MSDSNNRTMHNSFKDRENEKKEKEQEKKIPINRNLIKWARRDQKEKRNI